MSEYDERCETGRNRRTEVRRVPSRRKFEPTHTYQIPILIHPYCDGVKGINGINLTSAARTNVKWRDEKQNFVQLNGARTQTQMTH